MKDGMGSLSPSPSTSGPDAIGVLINCPGETEATAMFEDVRRTIYPGGVLRTGGGLYVGKDGDQNPYFKATCARSMATAVTDPAA